MSDIISDAQENLKRFVAQLGQYVPDPTNKRLMDPEAEYSPLELQAMLQEYGAYISNLSTLRRQMEAEDLILRRGSKIQRQIIMAQNRSGQGTLESQDAMVLASPAGLPILENESKLIKSESCLLIVKGWLEAYEQAYTSASRVVEVLKSESQATGGNVRFQ